MDIPEIGTASKDVTEGAAYVASEEADAPCMNDAASQEA